MHKYVSNSQTVPLLSKPKITYFKPIVVLLFEKTYRQRLQIHLFAFTYANLLYF